MLNTFLLFIGLFLSSSVCDDAKNYDDIPVVEGNGGTITTSVEDDVLVLTHENFDLHITTKDIILVEFYAPWCGHCKSLAPEYAKAAKILKDEDPSVPLAKIDGTVEAIISGRYEVRGYPTLFIFRKGQKFPYDGPRSAQGIVEYMKEQADPNWKPPPVAVITLTSENFTETVKKADIILVEFYAPWCGHCKKLAPEYERAAKVLKDLLHPIPLAKVDGTLEKELTAKYNITGWPTLMIFRKGKQFDYLGPRDEMGIVSYMKKQAEPPSEELTSVKSVRNVIKDDVTIVGFFRSKHEDLYNEFIEAAYYLQEKFIFFHSVTQSVLRYFGASNNTINLYQAEKFTSDYEPSNYSFTQSDASADDIMEFIIQKSIPLVGERSMQNRWKYDGKFPLVVVYYDVDFSFEYRVRTQLVRKEVTKVAKVYKGNITFVISSEEEFEGELKALNLADSGEDINVGYFKNHKIRYRMEPVEEFSSVVLKQFIEMVHSGNLAQQIQSQPVPKSNKGPVLVVVGSTFDELVMKSKKDMLLQFYAPWCGHCKALEPIYKKLGKAFSKNNKVTIAKIDATLNDFPEAFDLKGFPMIYFIPSSDKTNLIAFEEERTLEALTDFVNRHINSTESRKDEL